MKKNLKINLKRLTSGFISSVMMMSFILMPIPNVSVVYAETNEAGVECPDDEDYKNGAVYVAGCEFNKALSTTTFDSQARYEVDENGEKKKVFGIVPQEWISQYIVGLMGVILINSLGFKRLSKYNVKVYGNDCPKNIGPLISIPAAMASGVAYIVGDIQSNIQFQDAAKKAAEKYDLEVTDIESFTGKPKEYVGDAKAPEGATDEEKQALLDQAKTAKDGNDAQAEAYDALKDVLEGQKKALNTKRNMANLSGIGYGVADVVELGNMVWKHITCSRQWARVATDEMKSMSEFSVAMSAATTAAAAVATTAVCVDLPALLAGTQTTEKSSKAADLVKSSTYSLKTVRTSSKLIGGMTSLISGIKSIVPGASSAAGLAGLGKGLGSKAKEAAEEAADLTERIARDGSDIGAATAFISGFRTMDVAGDKCIVAKAAEDNFNANYLAAMDTPLQCCGGVGVNQATYAFAKTITTGSNLMVAFKSEGRKIVRDNILKMGFNAMVKELTGGLSDSAKQFSDIAMKEEMENNKRYKGTYSWQGIPKAPGVFSLKKDIKITGIGGWIGASLDSKKQKELENMKFYVRNMFESKLRGLAVRSLIKYDMDKPRKTLKNIVDVNKKIDEIMIDFNKYLDSDLAQMLENEQVNPNSLAFQKVIKKIANELFIPSANAIDMGATLAGAGLKAAGGMVEGPWSEVLNVGGKILMLHGILGGAAKKFLFVSPVSRALTWTTLKLLSDWTKKLADDAITKVDANIAVIVKEKQRFMDSGANGSGFAGNRSGMGRDGLKTSKYGANQLGKRNIKSCVVADGDNFLPSTCGAVTPREKFLIKGVASSGDAKNNPLGFANSMMADTMFGAGNDPDYAANMSSGDLAALESANNAISNLANKKRKEYDKIMESSDAMKKGGGESLSANIAKLRKVLFDNGVSGGGSGLGSSGGSGTAAPLASTKSTETLGTGNVVSGGGSGGGGSAPVAAIPSFDLDFGDEGEIAVGSDAIGAAKSAKKTEKLGDFVMKHNDINKRKDISIFKILSNRYILSYPKVLEEETSVQK